MNSGPCSSGSARVSSYERPRPARYNAAMTHADAFLQAILDAPDDDAPRLLYADWLDEHGDPDRAEFIRVQIALAARRSASPGLWRREQELLALHEQEWAAPVRGVANAWTFRRGFIEEVRADALALAEGADDLFRQAPVRSLQLAWTLTTPQRRLLPARLAECPHFVRLQALDLSGCCFLHDYGLSAFLASPYLTNLTSLRLNGCVIGDAGVRVLAGWPFLTRLTHLDLCGNGVSVAGLRV